MGKLETRRQKAEREEGEERRRKEKRDFITHINRA
jgi:hypothetical protein